MPLKPPILDARTFEEILEAAKLRIAHYAKDNKWTDFNDSDPGMTIVQLFAWLTESILFEVNKVPELNYDKFLKLLNLAQRPAKESAARLTFVPAVDTQFQSIPRRTAFQADASDGGEPITFETTADVDVIQRPLQVIQVFDGNSYAVIKSAEIEMELVPPFWPFGRTAQAGSALYLGFSPPGNPSTRSREYFPAKMQFGVFNPVEAAAKLTYGCDKPKIATLTGVKLQWEFKKRESDPRWRPLELLQDESAAFTREGNVFIAGPSDIEPVGGIGKTQEDKYFWIRCRLEQNKFPDGRSPLVDKLLPNTVDVVSLSTVKDEDVGRSLGRPDQEFELRFKPVRSDSLELIVIPPAGSKEVWSRVDDFLASERGDAHYTLDPDNGKVRFGDGQRGRIPAAGAPIVAHEYRWGGGDRTNVPAGAINRPLTSLPFVERTFNLRAAVGGRDRESREEFKRNAPKVLRSRNRAITSDDFDWLAQQVGGVVEVRAIANLHPEFPGVEVPGAVTVVLLPDVDVLPPRPSPDLLYEVCRYLDERRLITTELFVTEPDFTRIDVAATVAVEPNVSFERVKVAVREAIENELNPFWPPVRKRRAAKPTDSGLPFDARIPKRLGEDFHPTKLYDLIFNVVEVQSVDRLVYYVDGVEHDALRDSTSVPISKNGLAYFGDIDLTVRPEPK